MTGGVTKNEIDRFARNHLSVALVFRWWNVNADCIMLIKYLSLHDKHHDILHLPPLRLQLVLV